MKKYILIRDVVIRDLRKLFSQFQLLNPQIRVLKDNIQAIVVDNGITLPKEEKNTLLLPKYVKEVLKRLELPHASKRPPAQQVVVSKPKGF